MNRRIFDNNFRKFFSFNCNKPGFTLAEVLITLGIIGVVAALTIPSLQTAYKKHLIETRLKRAVTNINQIIKLSETDNDDFSSWTKTYPQDKFIDKYIRPYANIAQVCRDMSKCGYPTNDGYTWKDISGVYSSYRDPSYKAYGRLPFITQDGILYLYSYVTSDKIKLDNNSMVIVDINSSQGPNQHGQDVFFLYRDEEKNAIVPYGVHTRGIDVTNCQTGGDISKGFYCAAWICKNGWKIPKGYIIK